VCADPSENVAWIIITVDKLSLYPRNGEGWRGEREGKGREREGEKEEGGTEGGRERADIGDRRAEGKRKRFDSKRYGQFADLAIVDGRTRNISFIINDTSVAAVIPHFWFSAGMPYLFYLLILC
jgi:hypothetical protein